MKAVEKKFAVKIPAEKAEGLKTVNDLAEFVKSVPVSGRVTHLVVQYLAVDPERVVPEASFVDDLGADSLAQTELIMEFEEVFQLGEIPEEDAQKIVTVGDAVKYLEEQASDA
jgi:acyl carrier protein